MFRGEDQIFTAANSRKCQDCDKENKKQHFANVMGVTDETAVMGMCVKFFNQRANINEGRCVSLHIRTALQLSNNNSLTELLSAVGTEKSASDSIYFFSARHPLGARTESARLQTYLHMLQHFDSMLQAAIETHSTHTHTHTGMLAFTGSAHPH